MSATVFATKLAQFGVIGLGVMGQNLALNIEDHGQSVAVWNLEPEWVGRFVAANQGKQIVGNADLAQFVRSLESPRRILMMIKAGDPVDQMLERIAPLLEEGDILIDGGNSFFKDTQRREAAMRARGLNFFGMGVSGGEEGARHGPSLMPGGDPDAYRHVQSNPRVHRGQDSFGSLRDLCRRRRRRSLCQDGSQRNRVWRHAVDRRSLRSAAHSLGLAAQEIAEVFAQWNRGPLASYLIEISARDSDGDRPGNPQAAGRSGSGQGRTEGNRQVDGADCARPRNSRPHHFGRTRRPRALQHEGSAAAGQCAVWAHSVARYTGDRAELIAAIGDALYASKICSYAQGMSLIAAGAREWNWKINLREIARIWKGGCIIRALLLDAIMQAFERQPALGNLLLDCEIQSRITAAIPAWRKVAGMAASLGIPAPAFSASLAYFDANTAAQLPQNLTQAQRDFFGAHTYQRMDRPQAGFVHSDWSALIPRSNR